MTTEMIFAHDLAADPRPVVEVWAELSLSHHATSPGVARRFVAAQLAEAGLSALEDTATLLVSVLVTNAFLHAQTTMRLRVRVASPAVRVEVSDGSHDRPSRKWAAALTVTGRGLALLDGLADTWGVDVTARGKTIWFCLGAARPLATVLPLH